MQIVDYDAIPAHVAITGPRYGNAGAWMKPEQTASTLSPSPKPQPKEPKPKKEPVVRKDKPGPNEVLINVYHKGKLVNKGGPVTRKQAANIIGTTYGYVSILEYRKQVTRAGFSVKRAVD